jgi:hypothetical protein
MSFDEAMAEMQRYYDTPEGREKAVPIHARIYTNCQYINTLVDAMGLTHSGWDAGMPGNVRILAEDGVTVLGRAYAHMRCVCIDGRKNRHYLEKLHDCTYLLRGAELNAATYRKRYKGQDFIANTSAYGKTYSVWFETPPVKQEMLDDVREMLGPAEAQ